MKTRIYSDELAVAANQNIKEKEFWLNKLSGDLVKSSFPFDFIKGVQAETSTKMINIQFSKKVCGQLMKLSKGSDYTLYVILVAGLLVLINKYTNNRDILIGAPIYKQDIENDFINTILVLRSRLGENMTFKQLLLQVRQTIFEATENYNYPLEILPERLGIPDSNDGFPLFDVVVLLENIHDKTYIQHIHPNMNFYFVREDQSVEGLVEYNSLRYDNTTINRIMTHFGNLLERVLFKIELPIGELDLLSERERKQLLFDFNDTRANFPGDKMIPQLFEVQAASRPDRAAVVFEAEHLSYSEINKRANRWAWILRKKGVKDDTIVGIMVERSVEMISGILGILKAGGAYMPIDPDYPEERIHYMLTDSNVKALVVDDTSRASCLSFAPKALLNLSEAHHLNFPVSQRPSFPASLPSSLAYIIYTSGTTGRSKGVSVQHQSVVNMIWNHRKVFGENPESRISQVASSAFDAMVFEIWPCLSVGAVLCMADNETCMDPQLMKTWLIKNQITISFQSTLMAQMLLEEQWPKTVISLKVIRTAGDRLTCYPTIPYPFRFFNLYGPTEDTVWTTWTEVPVIPFEQEKLRLPPIGKPVGNKQVYILNYDMKMQPVGVSGELCISGDGLARGYLNNPELTSEKFIDFSHNIKHSTLNARIYLTGDLARWLPNGNIEFLGRIDHQVKIRGFRIELGEIENRLLKHTSIKEAVVLAREETIGDKYKYICAYTVADSEYEISEIREFLSKELPDYMIPSYFVQLEKLPLTPHGKVDRKALKKFTGKNKTGVEYAAPGDELEKTIANAWEELLGWDRVGRNDNFFDLGGTSLDIIRLNSRLKKIFQKDIPVANMFRYPTVRLFAKYLDSTEMQARSRDTVLDKGKVSKKQRLQRRKEIKNE
jgi:tyrocidine synthetase-3